LLFDEVVFADSQPQFIRRELVKDVGYGDNKNSLEMEKDYDFLLSEGIIKIFDPVELIQKNDVLLTTSISNDIHDDEFVKTSIQYSIDVWEILRERLPPSFLEVFYAGAGTFSEAISLQSLINRKGDLHKSSPDLQDFPLFWKGNSLSLDEVWEIFNKKYRFVVGGNPFIQLETYRLPFLQASSLRINEALLICASQNYTPFTDSGIHDKLMKLKVSRAAKNLSQINELREKFEIDLPLSIPQTHLAVSIIDRFIGSDDLAKREMKDILKYREKSKDSLTRFREKIAELSSEIETVQPGPEYEIKLRKLLDAKVIPEISKARDEVVSKYEETFGTLAKQSIQVVAPTLAATIFSGLGFWEILRTYPKIMLSKICEQAIWTKASQFCGFLHQRVAILRRFDNQPKVLSTTQRLAGKLFSPGMGHSSFGSFLRRRCLMCAM
jgi:hypothetical protein